ncbi:hypothetical protein [Natribacillus halophilus]|uniref:Uncharacterized protein n=1 Tax=Natribacillus halophilus TaxID=549003 RepID=A0A1G8SU43_9BACI|nr:hypothetical protein [Natribacillus halophilus]SDJ32711.1 hypothetical protein SAMN04488123_1369 [Natribacillus halophilus]
MTLKYYLITAGKAFAFSGIVLILLLGVSFFWNLNIPMEPVITTMILFIAIAPVLQKNADDHKRNYGNYQNKETPSKREMILRYVLFWVFVALILVFILLFL